MFAADSVASIFLILYDILFGRLFMFIPQLCPIVGPYFSTPSLLLKIIYTFTNHNRFAKSVAQIFMVLNRMSCVLIPATYNRLWANLTPIACFLVFLLPFSGIWNLWISREFLISVRGGFGISYIKAVPWASLSKFQSIFILTALFFTIIGTSITLYKLILLPGRIKSMEKSLCFTSLSISVTFLLVAITQLAFAFCGICISDALYILQFLAFDTFNVGSAVIMVSTNKYLRASIFSSGSNNGKIGNTITVMPSGHFSNNS